MKPTRLVIGPDSNGTVLEVEGDKVVSVGDPVGEVGREAGYRSIRHLDCADAQISLGSVNAHTHLYSGLVPFGMPAPSLPPGNFLEILGRVWWPLDCALDPGTVRASARFYLASALLEGTTCLVDHHESPNFIPGSLELLADVAEELGVRLVVAYGATERNRGRAEASAGLSECRRFLDTNRRPLVRGLVALHASFTVGDETISEAGALCRTYGVGLHVHVAEDLADVTDARSRGYADPFERLVQLDAVPKGSILAHCVHLDADAIRKIDEAGCWIVQNPRSNLGNRVGYPRTIRECSRIALGTDGYAARMGDERRALEALLSGEAESPDAAERRLDAGRRLAGEQFGVSFGMSAGSAADIVVEDETGVVHVVVGGEIVVENRGLVHADFEEIRAEAEVEAARLWSRLSV